MLPRYAKDRDCQHMTLLCSGHGTRVQLKPKVSRQHNDSRNSLIVFRAVEIPGAWQQHCNSKQHLLFAFGMLDDILSDSTKEEIRRVTIRKHDLMRKPAQFGIYSTTASPNQHTQYARTRPKDVHISGMYVATTRSEVPNIPS